MSCDRRGLRDYVLARTLRILPGFVAATTVVSLGLGAALTRLPVAEYLREPAVWSFDPRDADDLQEQRRPARASSKPTRTGRPLGTVWTLKYEVLCYLGVAGRRPVRTAPAALAGAPARGGTGAGASAVASGVRGPDLPKGVETALRLPLIFAAGACLYLWREQAARLGRRPRRPGLRRRRSSRGRRPTRPSCSSRRPTARSGSPSARWRTGCSIRPPTCPTGSTSTAGRSSRACTRSGRSVSGLGPPGPGPRPDAAGGGPVVVRDRATGPAAEGAGARADAVSARSSPPGRERRQGASAAGVPRPGSAAAGGARLLHRRPGTSAATACTSAAPNAPGTCGCRTTHAPRSNVPAAPTSSQASSSTGRALPEQIRKARPGCRSELRGGPREGSIRRRPRARGNRARRRPSA